MKNRFCIFIALAVLSGCSLIDDDLSVCGVDCRIDYTMRLQTNMRETVYDVLHAETDRSLADTLANWLAPIFSAQAHDVELSFYSADDGQDALRHHSTEVVDASSTTFTFYLPRENYYHLAVVNSSDNAGVRLSGTEHSATYAVATPDQDTLPSMQSAVYTARLAINAAGDADSYTYTVDLYMTSCAVALALDSKAEEMRHIDAYLCGTASRFEVGDSTFVYTDSRPVRCEQVTERCYAAVSLPSPDMTETPAGAPKRAMEQDVYWQLKVYVTLPDGTVTETVLDIDYPLHADALEIIRCAVQDNGSVLPVENAHIGATVQLDWKQGSEHEIDI